MPSFGLAAEPSPKAAGRAGAASSRAPPAVQGLLPPSAWRLSPISEAWPGPPRRRRSPHSPNLSAGAERLGPSPERLRPWPSPAPASLDEAAPLRLEHAPTLFPRGSASGAARPARRCRGRTAPRRRRRRARGRSPRAFAVSGRSAPTFETSSARSTPRKREQEVRIGVEPRADAVERRRHMLAHVRPIRAGAGHLDLAAAPGTDRRPRGRRAPSRASTACPAGVRRASPTEPAQSAQIAFQRAGAATAMSIFTL